MSEDRQEGRVDWGLTLSQEIWKVRHGLTNCFGKEPGNLQLSSQRQVMCVPHGTQQARSKGELDGIVLRPLQIEPLLASASLGVQNESQATC